jgi:transposase InsO family protein
VTFTSIQEMMDHWKSAYGAGDFSSAASVYEDNATLTVAGTPYQGLAEIEKIFMNFYNVTKQAGYIIDESNSNTVSSFILNYNLKKRIFYTQSKFDKFENSGLSIPRPRKIVLIGFLHISSYYDRWRCSRP